MRVTVESVNSAIDSITRDVHDMQNTIERFQSITRDISIDRLEAMCDAEREGRLVVLPCKVGEILAHVNNQNIQLGVLVYFDTPEVNAVRADLESMEESK
jgi:hypothetical protein